jgi:[protein-PII] uridylyltransferase
LLEEFFKAVNIIKKMILMLLEKKISFKRLWLSVKKGLTTNYYNKHLFIFDGIIYPSKKLINKKSLTPFEILNMFKFASITQSTLSVDLSNLIIKNVKNISSKEFINKDIDNIFKIILFQGKYVGQNLINMYESEVLSKIIPEFELLNCKVEFDSYHEYTVDQHILLCLATLDDIENNIKNELHNIYNKIENKFILRLGVLLHDIGKGIEVNNHSKSGAIIAENICNRLGLNDNEKDTVLFLIYNHLLISDLSFNREYEEKLIKEFAEKVKNINNLNMLYILTVIDIKNVGSKTWTDWKGIQLKELYNKTHYYLKNSSYIEKKDDYEIKLITPHSYYDEFYPDDIIKHKKWLKELKNKNEINYYFEDFKNFHQIIFTGYDRIHLFSDIVGLLTSEGYNILNARLYLTVDKKILNFFQLEPDHIRNLTNKEILFNIKKKINLIKEEKKSVDDFINERHKKYPVKYSIRDDIYFNQKSDVSIKLDNDSSDNFTIIEIKAKDRFGLLFRISRVLNNLKINIVSAKLQMRIDTAFDVFYVTDYLGLKIRDEKKCNQIVESLKINLQKSDFI